MAPTPQVIPGEEQGIWGVIHSSLPPLVEGCLQRQLSTGCSVLPTRSGLLFTWAEDCSFSIKRPFRLTVTGVHAKQPLVTSSEQLRGMEGRPERLLRSLRFISGQSKSLPGGGRFLPCNHTEPHIALSCPLNCGPQMSPEHLCHTADACHCWSEHLWVPWYHTGPPGPTWPCP